MSAVYESLSREPWFQQMNKEAAERSYALAMRPYAHYQGAPENFDWRTRIAPFNPIYQMVNESVAPAIGAHAPYINQAEQAFQRSMTPFNQQAQEYMNPYTQNVVNRISELGGRTFQENILPQLEHSFLGLGHHGSSQHRGMAERAARDLQSEILARQGQLLHSGFENAAARHSADQARAQNAASGLAGLGEAAQSGHLRGAGALSNIADMVQRQEQSRLDLPYQEFQRQEQYPRTALAEHMGSISGIPVATQSYGVTQPAAQMQQNTIGRLGDFAGSILGARLAHKAGGHISEPRMKKSNKKLKNLGALPLTQSSMVRHPKVGGKHSLLKRPMR